MEGGSVGSSTANTDVAGIPEPVATVSMITGAGELDTGSSTPIAAAFDVGGRTLNARE